MRYGNRSLGLRCCHVQDMEKLRYYQPLCQSPGRKVHGANMGPTWAQQDTGRPHVGPMNLAIWVYFLFETICLAV